MSVPRTIIVGAGIGGLTSAALLAAQGCDVTVVEAAGHPGGKVRQDVVGGVGIDAGPTVFTKRPIFDAIFDACGASLDDHIRLTPASILARHAWGEDRLDLFADPQASEDAIGAFAGADAARGYARFCAEAARVHDCIDKPFMQSSKTSAPGLAMRIAMQRPRDLFVMRPFESLWKVLGDYFPDPRLRQLFGRYATYCGSSPYLAPSTLMLIAHVEAEGVWFVDGGLSALARALEAIAMKNGATFRYDARVDRILTEKGRTSGVQLAGGERLSADTIVLNADSAALAAGAFGIKSGACYLATARSLSAMTFLGKVSAKGFPLTHHNVFFSSDYRAEFDAIARGGLAERPTAYLCAQDRLDHGHLDALERVQIIVNAPANGDTHHYSDREIDTCRTAMLATLAQSGLTLSGDLQPTTPTDFATRFPATGGALYGRASHGWAASFRRPGARTSIPGLYLAGGEHTSRRGRADGRAVGTIGRRIDHVGPRFDAIVPPQGYGWWYVDAISADRRFGLTIIGFVGSVFSPYYKASGRARPEEHCSINVALYGPRGSRWTMTERGSTKLRRSADTLEVGPSAMLWDGNALTIDIRETGCPIPFPVRGTVRLYPEQISGTAFGLHEDGQHLWHPIAPRARVEICMDAPDVRWSGSGYLDSNFGREPLEAGFREWQWSRAHLKNDVAVIYEGERRDGTDFAMALRYDRQGMWHDAELPPAARLPGTGFGMPRRTRGSDAKVIKTWENAPFYSRSALSTELYGERVDAVHESLSMDRFVSPIVQWMLPFRMPRFAR